MRYKIYEREGERWRFVKEENGIHKAKEWIEEQIQIENPDGLYHVIDNDKNEVVMTIGNKDGWKSPN